MKKRLLTLAFVVTFFACSAVSASAADNGIVKVGLRYGADALFSANLENAEGEGYDFGWFDGDREFVSIGSTRETTISMTAAGDIYMSENGTYADSPSSVYRSMGAWHVQLDETFRDYEDAEDAARDCDGWPAWIDGDLVVRTGCYESRNEARDAAGRLGGEAVRSSDTGILVTVTRTTDILFEFDGAGQVDLGVRPDGWGDEAVTWFKGYKYPGAFEYRRTNGGNLTVINVVDLEDYVRGVVPYEMSSSWPLEALKAQAVCARTYACRPAKHGSYGFDLCSGVECQMYRGLGSATELTDRAVAETAGECIYYDGQMIEEAVFHSSDGGATEDVENVWGGNLPYLRGKQDPYEGQISIPNYQWSVTYTADELTWVLQNSNRDVGQITNVYVSARTPLGNVKEVTFEHTGGAPLVVKGDTCRTVFYSSTLQKSVKSLRFSINGEEGPIVGGDGGVYAGGSAEKLDSLDGAAVLSGKGTLGVLRGNEAVVLSADGKTTVSAEGGSSRGSERNASRKRPSDTDTFTITGTGNGHNVGMSQYGAKAMAELGHDYQDILTFYYTGITVE